MTDYWTWISIVCKTYLSQFNVPNPGVFLGAWMSLWRHNVAFGGTYVARVIHVMTTSDVTVRCGVAPWLADGGELGSDWMMVRSGVLTSAWIIQRFPPSSMSAGPGRTFLCAQYGKAFTRRTNLKRHQRTHQPGSGCLQCVFCQKKFSRDRRADLVRHCRWVHHQQALEPV